MVPQIITCWWYSATTCIDIILHIRTYTHTLENDENDWIKHEKLLEHMRIYSINIQQEMDTSRSNLSTRPLLKLCWIWPSQVAEQLHQPVARYWCSWRCVWGKSQGPPRMDCAYRCSWSKQDLKNLNIEHSSGKQAHSTRDCRFIYLFYTPIILSIDQYSILLFHIHFTHGNKLGFHHFHRHVKKHLPQDLHHNWLRKRWLVWRVQPSIYPAKKCSNVAATKAK